MALLRANCPRCGTQNATFDVSAQNSRGIVSQWIERFEVFSVCRSCHRATTFLLDNKNYDLRSEIRQNNGLIRRDIYLNDICNEVGYLNIKDNNILPAPNFTPAPVACVFEEGTTCMAVECWNAAGAMFRAAIDLTTKDLLPTGEETNAKIRRSLGLRLKWMFDNNVLPIELKELAEAVQQDGNDGAHDASLSKRDALDLQDFTEQLLTRLFTIPGRLKEAAERRAARRL